MSFSAEPKRLATDDGQPELAIATVRTLPAVQCRTSVGGVCVLIEVAEVDRRSGSPDQLEVRGTGLQADERAVTVLRGGENLPSDLVVRLVADGGQLVATEVHVPGHDGSPSISADDVAPSPVSELIVGDAPGAPASPAVDAPGAALTEVAS